MTIDPKTVIAVVSLALLSTGCLVRPNAGAAYDEPGIHPQAKVAIVVPPGNLSSDGRIAAAQIGLAIASAAVMNDMTPGVGNSPAPHVPGRTGVAPGTTPDKAKSRHPNAYLAAD